MNQVSYFLFSFLIYLCEGRLVWKNDIKISSSDLDDDLERIPSKLLASLGLLVDQGKLERFNSLTDSQPEVREEYKEVSLRDYDYQLDYEEPRGRNPSRKRLAEPPDYGTTGKSFINGTEQELEYDLDDFRKDYENRLPEVPEMASVIPISNMSVIETQDNTPFKVTEINEYSNQCLRMALWKHFFFGIPCFLHEIRNVFGSGTIFNAIKILFKTILLVFPSFFFISLCLWCYNGMCSCLFPFEFFHPYNEIIKIKKLAYELPPGTYYDEEGNMIPYRPMREEVECYMQLLEMIRS